jgi:hypothetical protein
MPRAAAVNVRREHGACEGPNLSSSWIRECRQWTRHGGQALREHTEESLHARRDLSEGTPGPDPGPEGAQC